MVLMTAVGCGVTVVILVVGFYIIVLQGVADFFEAMKPGCGWVTDADSFAEYADVRIPADAVDMHFSGCSYGQALVIAARFQMPKNSSGLDEFITMIGFDQPLAAQYNFQSDFGYVYDGESWWHPDRSENYIGGSVVHSGKFYDILIESLPHAYIIYLMVQVD